MGSSIKYPTTAEPAVLETVLRSFVIRDVMRYANTQRNMIHEIPIWSTILD